METGITEAILVEVVARLPFRSIARFKSVSKIWKSMIESEYFRRLFLSLHRNLSPPWSLMSTSRYGVPIAEAISFYGYETWGLPESLGSYILSLERYPSLLSTLQYSCVAYSYGLIRITVFANDHISFVGNPVLKQWVQIPPPPRLGTCSPTESGLVTRVEDGVVLGFKLIRSYHTDPSDRRVWRMHIYSSETGKWTSKRLQCSRPSNNASLYPPVNVNGRLYLCEIEKNYRLGNIEYLVAHDFYASGPASDQCQIIPLPGNPNEKNVRRALITSGDDLVFVEILYERLKLWKLNNNNTTSDWWTVSWEINIATLGFDANYFPMAMNPFDADVIYLWSHQLSCLVSCNLRKQEFIVLRESECRDAGLLINTDNCKKYVEGIIGRSLYSSLIILSQFVLPQWMESVPRPPN